MHSSAVLAKAVLSTADMGLIGDVRDLVENHAILELLYGEITVRRNYCTEKLLYGEITVRISCCTEIGSEMVTEYFLYLSETVKLIRGTN